MKKALFVATIGGFFGFECNDIQILQSLGYEVHIAANLSLSDFQADGIIRHQIDFARIPWSKTNLIAYKQLKMLFKETRFDLVHCHTPMGGVLARLTAKKYRKTGTKVIYTAHGFHFYKGAPLKNWFLYYPVEWICAHWTDVHAKRVEYVPGVGIDLHKFAPASHDIDKEYKKEIMKTLQMSDGDKLILSVGELNKNKNHEVVIRALAVINDISIHYAIAGTGDLQDYLENLAKELGIPECVHFLGYRSDVADLYRVADLYIHPSLREGLPVALMEAIASKTSVICSDIRGNTDLVGGDALFEPKNVNMIADKICEYLKQDNTEEVEKNYAALKKFDLEEVASDVKVIYSGQTAKIERGGGNIS